jgi:hypothetical protein
MARRDHLGDAEGMIDPDELAEGLLPMLLLLVLVATVAVVGFCMVGGLLSWMIARQRRAIGIGALTCGIGWFVLSRWGVPNAVLGGWLTSVTAGWMLRARARRPIRQPAGDRR